MKTTIDGLRKYLRQVGDNNNYSDHQLVKALSYAKKQKEKGAEGSDAAKGKMMISTLEFLSVWHDKDVDGNEFIRYGITVGPPIKKEKSLQGETFDRETDLRQPPLRQTPRSGGNTLGGEQVTNLRRPITYGTGEGVSAYNADFPEHRAKGMKPPEHEYSSTQFNLEDAGYAREDGSPLDKIKQLQDEISPEDLHDKGLEHQPHITLLYGLHTNDIEEVRRVVSRWVQARRDRPTLTARLGEVSVFPASVNSDQDANTLFDVLKITVESEDLENLHNFLADHLPHTDTHPDYSPHVTLAYLKPGLSWLYVGEGLEGQEIVLNELIFSDKNRTHTVIDLFDEARTGVKALGDEGGPPTPTKPDKPKQEKPAPQPEEVPQQPVQPAQEPAKIVPLSNVPYQEEVQEEPIDTVGEEVEPPSPPAQQPEVNLLSVFSEQQKPVDKLGHNPMYQSFIKEVVDNPGDPAPLMVMADWLDEQGENATANSIRSWRFIEEKTEGKIKTDLRMESTSRFSLARTIFDMIPPGRLRGLYLINVEKLAHEATSRPWTENVDRWMPSGWSQERIEKNMQADYELLQLMAFGLLTQERSDNLYNELQNTANAAEWAGGLARNNGDEESAAKLYGVWGHLLTLGSLLNDYNTITTFNEPGDFRGFDFRGFQGELRRLIPSEDILPQESNIYKSIAYSLAESIVKAARVGQKSFTQWRQKALKESNAEGWRCEKPPCEWSKSIKVRIVDSKICFKSATHLDFKYIPHDEIWLHKDLLLNDAETEVMKQLRLLQND